MSKKILIIAESIDIEDSSGSKANVALIRNLKKAGYDLRVYHYTRKEIQIEGIACFSIEENRRSLLFFLSRTERYLRYLFRLGLNRPLEKLFGFSFTLLNDRDSIVAKLKKIKDFNPDLILTLSKGGSFRPHHALLQLPELHDRWLAYIHDPYPMHWYPPPYPWYEPGYRQKEEFMKKVGLKARYLGFPSWLLLEWMGNKFKPYKEKGIVIPHQLESKTGFKKECKADDFSISFDPLKFNIVHAGNLIRGREPFGLIESFKQFLSSNPKAGRDARLMILGGKNYYSEYLNSNQKEYSQIVLSNSKLSFEETQKIQEAASANVILEAKSEISPFLPGKFPHCIEANKKILLLGPSKSESRRLLGNEYRFWAEIDDKKKIALLLEELFKIWQKDKAAMKLNREDLEDYLSVSELIRTMNSLFVSQKKGSHE